MVNAQYFTIEHSPFIIHFILNYSIIIQSYAPIP